jgi:hypothetical protein
MGAKRRYFASIGVGDIRYTHFIMHRIAIGGRERLREAQIDTILHELVQEYAEELRNTTSSQRRMIQQRLKREAERRVDLLPQPSRLSLF